LQSADLFEAKLADIANGEYLKDLLKKVYPDIVIALTAPKDYDLYHSYLDLF